MPPPERDSYETIKTAALLAYFDFCRDRGHCLGRPHEELIGAVEYEFEHAYPSVVEQLMFKVVLLVLSAGMDAVREAALRTRIESQIRSAGLSNVLKDVPKLEAEEFKRDLRVFGLI